MNKPNLCLNKNNGKMDYAYAYYDVIVDFVPARKYLK